MRNLLKWIFPILSIVTIITLFKFAELHMLYFPEEIPLTNHEYVVLFASLLIFIVSMYYKLKVNMIISLICIILSLVNIVGFSVAASFYYRELLLKQFI